VIQPDGQSVTFHFNYMYSTNIREPVRADEKHLGRVKRHFIDTDVVSGNYELREVSTYRVSLKAARSSRGVPLLEDVPGVGVLFRPQINAESSLQQNIVLSQSVIYPTLFDLMGLRWAPAVSDLDALSLQEREFVTRNREKFLRNQVFDYSSLQVDEFMRIPEAERRGDLYRTQETIPGLHPNKYQGPGLNLKNGVLQEGYAPEQFQQPSGFVPNRSEEAQFQLEQPPRQGMLAVPMMEAVPGTAFSPGFPVPPQQYEMLEGAMPIDPFCPQDETDTTGRAYLEESNSQSLRQTEPAANRPLQNLMPRSAPPAIPEVPAVRVEPMSRTAPSTFNPFRSASQKRTEPVNVPQDAPPANRTGQKVTGDDVAARSKISMRSEKPKAGLSRLIPGAWKSRSR